MKIGAAGGLVFDKIDGHREVLLRFEKGEKKRRNDRSEQLTDWTSAGGDLGENDLNFLEFVGF